MRRIFADSVYWIALINPADQRFEKAQTVSATLGAPFVVTTTEVLTETLNFYAERGENKRDGAALLTRSILLDVNIEVITSTHEGFLTDYLFMNPAAIKVTA